MVKGGIKMFRIGKKTIGICVLSSLIMLGGCKNNVTHSSGSREKETENTKVKKEVKESLKGTKKSNPLALGERGVINGEGFEVEISFNKIITEHNGKPVEQSLKMDDSVATPKGYEVALAETVIKMKAEDPDQSISFSMDVETMIDGQLIDSPSYFMGAGDDIISQSTELFDGNEVTKTLPIFIPSNKGKQEVLIRFTEFWGDKNKAVYYSISE